MTPEEIWMRHPQIQCEEEIVISEGAAYTPEVMKHYLENNQRYVDNMVYISVVPSADFQVLQYEKREWVPYVLEGCTDKKQAFQNWMNRDILFVEKSGYSMRNLEFRVL